MYKVVEAGQFAGWLKKCKDLRVKQAVLKRINMMILGRFGDCKYLNNKIFEMRIHHGPGYRIYYSLQKEKIIILLCAGDKKTQTRDIKKAVKILNEWIKHEDIL